MTRNELKQRIDAAIDRRAEEIIGLGEQIRKNPELGFKEVKTARLVEETFGRLGLSAKGGLAMTGVRADVAGRAGDGPTFALLGELDALVVSGHPVADPQGRVARLQLDHALDRRHVGEARRLARQRRRVGVPLADPRDPALPGHLRAQLVPDQDRLAGLDQVDELLLHLGPDDPRPGGGPGHPRLSRNGVESSAFACRLSAA